jgi:uncharacterized protein YwqG
VAAHAFATKDVEEAGYLARVGRDFGARGSYVAYADWLRGRDSASATFVRRFAEHVFDGASLEMELPPHRNSSWFRLLGGDWHPLIRSVGSDAQTALNAWVRPVVSLSPVSCPDPEIPLGSSKFGGPPHLPTDFAWPTCAHGPLRFQAQINLHELRSTVAVRRYDLPMDGWLVLFAFDDDGEKGYQPGVVERDGESWVEIPDLTHVEYIPALTPLVRRSVPPETALYDGSDWSCRLILAETLDVPHANDTNDSRFDEHIANLMHEFRGGWSSKLMGYPTHYRTDNTSPGPDWLNLFTLGSDDVTGWCWCDGEHLDVYVHSEGVANGTFKPFYGYAA